MADLLDQLRSTLAGRYVIERELGRGGMARVYAAVDKRHGRQVAMKVFPPELAQAIGPERFRREIAITSRLVHPHILALHDSGNAAGALYYVMPLVQGESLRERIDREPAGLPPDEVVSLAREIAGALSHAHRLGVIHRDVSTENILVADGHALLADFGIARLLDSDNTITETGTPLGTPMYRSPEQAAGHANVDGRSDIYSLGCVLYESLGGTRARPLLSNRFAQPVPPLRKLRPEIPVTVDAAVSRAMMPNPDDRFASADEFARALTEPQPGVRVRRLPQRLSRKVLLAALVLAVAVAGFTTMHSRAPALLAKRVVVGHFENRTGDSTLDVLGEMADDYVARGLAETRLVEVIDARGKTAPSIDVARSAGAATTVRGSYYRTGDTLYFESQILDTRSGKLIMSTQPAIGAIENRMKVLEQLRQRLMTSFAALYGRGFEAWQAQSIPPSYEAYEEVLAGTDAEWRLDNNDAIDHFRRAVAMDSSYLGAKTNMVLAAGLEKRCALADSVAAELQGSVARLAAVDRGQLDWGEAQCRGDWPAALRAGRAVIAAAPRSISFNILLGVTALELFRPHEALAVLGKIDPSVVELTAEQHGIHTDFTALGLHELGDFRKELALVRRTLRVFPDEPQMRMDELISLAALGDVKELKERRAAWFKRADLFSNVYWSQGQLDLCVSAELRAHGHSADASLFMKAAAEWYRINPRTQEEGPIPPTCTVRLLAPIYYLGRADEARALYQRMLAADSTSSLAHEGLGALAARRGDRAEVQRMEEWLSSHPHSEKGRSTYARARMAILLGDRERGVTLLREAFDQGLSFRMFVHLDPDLEAVRNLPAYRQLVEIKG